MTLLQMFNNAMAASYYSRSAAEVYSKLNEGGFEVYTAVLKEFSGFFIKFDETSLVLSPNQANQEYTLPADLGQIVHVAERVSSTEQWHPMDPAGDIENVLVNQLVNGGILSVSYGTVSPFEYYGPFLDAAAAQGAAAAQIQKLRIDPVPDQNHFVQLVYTAKWLPIVNQASILMMPDEGTYAMEKRAIAKLLRLNDDDLAEKIEAEALEAERRFLTWLRHRQIQQFPMASTYLADTFD